MNAKQFADYIEVLCKDGNVEFAVNEICSSEMGFANRTIAEIVCRMLAKSLKNEVEINNEN